MVSRVVKRREEEEETKKVDIWEKEFVMGAQRGEKCMNDRQMVVDTSSWLVKE